MNELNDKVLILFDGVCNYCNQMVQFALRHENGDHFRFAPLQSTIGENLKKLHNLPRDLDSVVVIHNGRVFTHSDAPLYLSRFLQAPFKWMSVGVIAPRFMRDAIYKYVARNRYKWFGKKETCMIPTPEQRAKFL